MPTFVLILASMLALAAEPGEEPPFFVEITRHTKITGGPSSGSGSVNLDVFQQGRLAPAMRKDPFTGQWGIAACDGWTVDLAEAAKGRPFCMRLRFISGSVKATGNNGARAIRFTTEEVRPAADPVVGSDPDGKISSDGKTVRIQGKLPSVLTDDEDAFACDDAEADRTQPLDAFLRLDDIHRTAELPQGHHCGSVLQKETTAHFMGSLPAEVFVQGPHCACGAKTVEVTATARDPKVTFKPFEVIGRPGVRTNDGGKAAKIVLSGDGETTGKVRLVPVFAKGGRTEKGPAHEVSFCKVKKPIVTADPIGRGNLRDFVYSEATPAVVELSLEGRAFMNGEDVSQDLTWDLEPNPNPRLETSAARGRKQRFKGEGLPSVNTSFGPRRAYSRLAKEACDCRAEEPAEVRLFYPQLARNNPGGKNPNWEYYYSQTRARQDIAYEFVEALPPQQACGPALFAERNPDPTARARYDYCADVLYLSPRVMSAPCPGHTSRDDVRERYIDCYAATLKHENTHRLEFTKWWGVGLARYASSEDDDRDLVPNSVEDATPGCDRKKAKSCPGRPAWAHDLVDDREMDAYVKGWTWNNGSADDQDWAKPGKNWPKK